MIYSRSLKATLGIYGMQLPMKTSSPVGILDSFLVNKKHYFRINAPQDALTVQ